MRETAARGVAGASDGPHRLLTPGSCTAGPRREPTARLLKNLRQTFCGPSTSASPACQQQPQRPTPAQQSRKGKQCASKTAADTATQQPSSASDQGGQLRTIPQHGKHYCAPAGSCGAAKPSSSPAVRPAPVLAQDEGELQSRGGEGDGDGMENSHGARAEEEVALPAEKVENAASCASRYHAASTALKKVDKAVAYRDALAALFPTKPGRYSLEDLKIDALGLQLKPLLELRTSVTVTTVQIVLPGDFSRPILGGPPILGENARGAGSNSNSQAVETFSASPLLPGCSPPVELNYIAWYNCSGSTKAHMWDSTYNREKPLRITHLDRGLFFPGLEEAVKQLNRGAKAVAYIPPGKAFGSRGFKALVPPNAHLIMWLSVER